MVRSPNKKKRQQIERELRGESEGRSVGRPRLSKSEKTEVLTVRIPISWDRELEKLSGRWPKKRPKGDMVRMAIKNFLEGQGKI